MKVLIVEDELPAAKRLTQMIREIRPKAEVVKIIDSVEAARGFFKNEPLLDLAFFDIQLADGLSFDIFEDLEIRVPIIFTTAYDQYMLKAFKVNSIDYLLKPIDDEELSNALNKYDRLFAQTTSPVFDKKVLQELIMGVEQPPFRKRFLIKIGQQLTYLNCDDIRYFYSDEGIVYAKTYKGKKHMIDYTLDQIENMLDPVNYFRINRKIILHVEAIDKIHPYFNSRLKLELNPHTDLEVIVSRDRVSNFKKWLDS
jgi:DNA-binding LytR/AlgR family response regulator